MNNEQEYVCAVCEQALMSKKEKEKGVCLFCEQQKK